MLNKIFNIDIVRYKDQHVSIGWYILLYYSLKIILYIIDCGTINDDIAYKIQRWANNNRTFLRQSLSWL